MRDYILPIPELKKIEPILTEYFGYKRAMFENELLATYYHEYRSEERRVGKECRL